MIKNFNIIYNLKPADVIIAKSKQGVFKIINHYIVYVGDNRFIGNLEHGVTEMSINDITQLSEDYKLVGIKHFKGNQYERNEAINRAYSRLGDRYSLLTFNCEHFANWVQKGKEYSSQVSTGIILVLIALGLYSTYRKKTNQ